MDDSEIIPLEAKIAWAAWETFAEHKERLIRDSSKIVRLEDRLQVLFTAGFTHGWFASLKHTGLPDPREA